MAAATPRAPRRRSDDHQAALDMRALEIAAGTAARVDGLEQLLDERDRNVNEKLTDIKQNNEKHHTDNQGWLRTLDKSLSELKTALARSTGSDDGRRLMGMSIKDALMVLFAGASLVASVAAILSHAK